MPPLEGDRHNWSRFEVEAAVANYFDMLLAELRNEPYNKAGHNRDLRKLLNQRSRGSVELKHANISAVLIELGLPYIDGYKPRSNYQELLGDVVAEWVARTPELISHVAVEVELEPTVPSVDDILKALVAAPTPRQSRPVDGRIRERQPRYPRRPNYLFKEAMNSALGRAGEQFVINFERARLLAEGKPKLAAKVEQVSMTRGDAEGFDILSFDVAGRDRLIEVKTTRYGAYTPFFVTQNELERSREDEQRYHLYRVFGFRKQPRLFTLAGAVDKSCELDPAQYVARVG